MCCTATMALKSHDVESAIDVNDFASDSRTCIRGKEDSSASDFFDFHAAAQWGAFFVTLEHFAKASDAARGESLDRTSRDGVNPNFLFPQLKREIANRAFKS